MNRILLTGGTVVDGTGAEPFAADLLVENGRIARIGRFDPPPADARAIECAGLVVAPGFIDVHSHSDLQVIEGRRDKLRQGVTREVVGNCGFSAFPAAEDRRALHDFANGIFCGDADWGWTTAAEYLAAAPAAASLVGHGSLRIAIAGPTHGPLDARDLDRMEQVLSGCLTEGAIGFSTGLMYAPGSSAPFDELARLCRVVARHGKIYATHMRSYFGGILDAIDEQLALARASGCRLQISHLQIAGRKNWNLQPSVIEKIERARAEGIDVAFDCYPYTAGSTVLTQILPQRALDGGTEALLARLADRTTRDRIAAETCDDLAWSWEDIYISAAASPANAASAVGKNIATLARERERAPIDVVLDLLLEERAAVNMISFNQSEDNLRQTLAHPLSMIISDGFYVKGRPHPRLFGTFPQFLESRLLPLPEAVRKITGLPAERFQLGGRGRLAEGFAADITVFDPSRIGSDATYERPEVAPRGIRLVVRDGVVLEEP